MCIPQITYLLKVKVQSSVSQNFGSLKYNLILEIKKQSNFQSKPVLNENTSFDFNYPITKTKHRLLNYANSNYIIPRNREIEVETVNKQ